MHLPGRRVLALICLPLGVAGLSTSTLTAAAWSDSESATSTLSAGRIDPPTIVDCTDGLILSAARVRWAAPEGTTLAPDGYVVELARKGVLVPDGARRFAVGPGDTHFDISPDLMLLGEYTVTVFSVLGDSWVSGPSNVWVVDTNVSVQGVGVTSCEGRLLDLI